MQKFFLVRHGETDWNVEKRIQGHTDIPLNAQGRLQAQKKAQILKQEPFDACFSSDLSRAHQTAQILIEGRPIPLHLDIRLRERHHGSLEGCLWHEYHAISPEQRDLIVESPETMVKRLFSTFADITQHRALIVTHGGVINALLHQLLPTCQKIFVGNLALVQISWQGETASLVHHEGIEISL